MLEPYLEAVREFNPDGKLRYYPGSPLIAKRFLRPGDRMVLVELNKADHEVLTNVFAREKRVAVENIDAYQALKAYLPPAERRGLVLIDSSFDVAREFDRIVKALKQAYARWDTGVYAVWYPLMEPAAMRDFLGSVAALGHTQGAAHGDRGARARRKRDHPGLRHARRESAVALRRRSEDDREMARAEARGERQGPGAGGLARAGITFEGDCHAGTKSEE